MNKQEFPYTNEWKYWRALKELALSSADVDGTIRKYKIIYPFKNDWDYPRLTKDIPERMEDVVLETANKLVFTHNFYEANKILCECCNHKTHTKWVPHNNDLLDYLWRIDEATLVSGVRNEWNKIKQEHPDYPMTQIKSVLYYLQKEKGSHMLHGGNTLKYYLLEQNITHPELKNKIESFDPVNYLLDMS